MWRRIAKQPIMRSYYNFQNDNVLMKRSYTHIANPDDKFKFDTKLINANKLRSDNEKLCSCQQMIKDLREFEKNVRNYDSDMGEIYDGPIVNWPAVMESLCKGKCKEKQ